MKLFPAEGTARGTASPWTFANKRYLVFLMRTGLYYILFFLFSVQLLFAKPTSGQNMEATQLTLGLKNESLAKAFMLIEGRTDFLFAFQPGQVAAYKKLNLPAAARSLNATMDLLLAGTDLAYRQMGNSILIYKKIADTRRIREWKENVLLADTVIHGRVLNKKGEPLAGVSVVIRGTNKGVTTGPDGTFTTMLRVGQTLNFSAVGYKSFSLKPQKGEGGLKVVLEPEATNLNDVVVVGYGTQKKADLTGAVSTVDVNKTFESKPINDAAKALQGVVPGLTIQYGNGGLTANPNIKIRGIGSVNGTSRPLILVDNVEADDLTVLNPADIESVSVLKDAASASIYGTRAAFGVILIKTKTGKRNQPTKVTYSNNFGWSTPTVQPDFADPAKELIGLDSAGLRATGTTPQLFGMELSKIQAGVVNWEKNYSRTNTGLEMIKGEDWDIDPTTNISYFYRVWDPKKMMFNKYTFSQQHNINIQGGSEKANYYVSAGYSDDQGIWKLNPDGLKKYNITGGINLSVNSWLDLDAKTTFRNYEYDYPYQYQQYFYYFWRWGAYFPYGTYQGNYFRGPAAYLSQASKSSMTDEYTRIDLGATLKILKNLNVRADYTIGRDNAIRHETGGPVNAWDFWTAGKLPLTNIATAAQNVVNYYAGRYLVNTLNAYATWQFSPIKDNHFKLIGGINVDNNENINFEASRQGLLDPSQGELGLASGTQLVSGGPYTNIPDSLVTNPSNSSNGHGKNAYAGYFARLNYDYQEKFLLELNGRYDGSSTFPVESRWAFFPSASAGYRISREDFMQALQPVLSDLKFRVSYGEIGNQDLGSRSLFLPVLNGMTPNWLNGGTSVQTVSQPTAVAGSLKWERVNTLDIGADARFFHNHIGLTVDWFQRSTLGMVQPTSVPATFGTGGPYINAGNFRTQGYEIAIDANYALSKDLTVYGNLNLSDGKTVFTKWNNPNLSISNATGINYKGKTYGEIWGFQTDRYFTSNQDVTNSPNQVALQSGNFKYGPGDIKYKDRNHDGKIDAGNMTLNNHGDLKVIGNTQPRYQFNARLGASYKGFDIDVFIQGVALRHYWGAGNIVIPLYQGTDILYANQLDYWTPSNTNARFARPYAGNSSSAIAGIYQGSGNYYPQSKYLLNMAYGRLKSLSIGYTLPGKYLERKGIHKLRFYVSGENLFTISHVGAPIDPEITDGELSSLGRTFPFDKTYSFGTQLTF